MSSEIAISARKLTKIYRTYENPLNRVRQALSLGNRIYYRQFTALSGISFDIERGETVGIIGRNGSGKSTLLQLVCGIRKPTAGDIRVSGRISALLELGAGFHPEFTGRENVHMYGAILGIPRAEMEKRFPEIEAFAEIGEFVDEPVKTYSSGMFLRLAFATIAHVDADIIVIDEALSVGDALFAQKCMRFLRDFRKRGTLLIVSHDMAALLNLCDRVIWLDKGAIRSLGLPKNICETYLQLSRSGQQNAVANTPASAPPTQQHADRSALEKLGSQLEALSAGAPGRSFGAGGARITAVRLAGEGGDTLTSTWGGEAVVLSISAKAHAPLQQPIIGFVIRDRLGQSLFGENTYSAYADKPVALAAGNIIEARFRFRMPRLQSGSYSISVAVADGTQLQHVQHHWINDAYVFESRSGAVHGLVGIPMLEVSLAADNPAL